MKSNFQQFAVMGNPWTTPQSYVREEQDAANPKCSTARRRSARDYVEIRKPVKKSHNMCFSEESGPERKQSQAARVLAIRNRLAAAPAENPVLADWQAEQRVFVPKQAAKSGSGSTRKAERRADRKYLNQFRRVLNRGLRAYIIHSHYADIIRLYGTVNLYLEGE